MARQGYGDEQSLGWDMGMWVSLAWKRLRRSRVVGSWRLALLRYLWGRA